MSTSYVPCVLVYPRPRKCLSESLLWFQNGNTRGACTFVSVQLASHYGVEDPCVASGSGSPVVQGSGDCCQLEVRPSVVHSCPVSGDADRHISREGVPVGSSLGSPSGSDDFYFTSFITSSGHVAAVVGKHGFAGALSSSRSLTHVPIAVAPQGPLVPHGGQPCH